MSEMSGTGEKFEFVRYGWDGERARATFVYRARGHQFVETMDFVKSDTEYDEAILERALFLAWILAGTSYYKCWPTREVVLPEEYRLDENQARFFDAVYQEGLGQFAFENGLTREDLAHFESAGAAKPMEPATLPFMIGKKVLSLQSGGKDSLLVADLLDKRGTEYMPWFIASGEHHPAVLDELGHPLRVARRTIDREGLEWAKSEGALNGHVPITYIVQAYAVCQAILSRKDAILVAIGQEGVEPHAWIGDLPINHQWSKTWAAEQMFADYVRHNVAEDLYVGSPLRDKSEVQIARLFAENSWERFGHRFSSCNVANYRQHADNSELKWCGDCPKCANTYLMFAPFVDTAELQGIFEGQDLLAKPALEYSYKGLLGVDGVMKPFECVGSTEELGWAYHHKREGYADLPFEVPEVGFDVAQGYDAQKWATDLVK
jgi:hypothetical protein